MNPRLIFEKCMSIKDDYKARSLIINCQGKPYNKHSENYVTLH